ncbi:MAG: protein-disulfide reductase DsbD family protein [Candidatus Omnitrophota bacterium]|nr:protein-disulfide reductase DsbD family protein [Candidatus Omnitrophota bacterium]
MRPSLLFSVLILLAISVFDRPGFTASVRSANAEAELVSEVRSLRPGQNFWIGLRLKMDRGWHTYWKNPGDSGLPTEIQWELPPGFSSGEIEWPYPGFLRYPPLAAYGYSGEIVLLTQMQVADSVPASGTQVIRAKAKWLSCKLICIPGEADLEMKLPVRGEMPEIDPLWIKRFAQARERLPLEVSDWEVRGYGSDDKIMLEIVPPSWVDYKLSSVSFYPESSEWIQHASDQHLESWSGGYRLWLERSSLESKLPELIRGVLVSPEGWRGRNSERALEFQSALKPLTAAPAGGVKTSKTGLLLALVFAFLGGMILNLMPCVLPVLSLKILGFVQHSGEKSMRMWAQGLFYTLGVVASFWLLAGLLLVIRAGGEQIGWGFQLQSPVILGALSLLFFVLALNIFDVYEIGTSLTGAGKHAGALKGGVGSFASGILATVVATPCTAPFMGAALGFALTRPPAVAIAVFTTLGLGMAFPYLFLSLFPGLVARLPKPGPWMIRLKNLLGMLLMATVAWLVWVLHIQSGTTAVLVLTVCLVAAGLVCRQWGSRQGMVRGRQWVVGVLLYALLLPGIVLLVRSEVLTQKQSTVNWETFSPERLESLRREGHPVFIDFTAAWCLSCQVNKRVVLDSSKVADRLRELGVVTLRADWTSRDETITRSLAGYGRNSIPLYVLYGHGPDREPVLLPEILTSKIILDALEENVVRSSRRS